MPRTRWADRQMALRMPQALMDRAERVRTAMERAHADQPPPTVSTVLRLALGHGLKVLERRYRRSR